jgi:putative transposase
MGAFVELNNREWTIVQDLFDPPGRRGAPARLSRRRMVNAMLFLARTGIQWRYLPARYGRWEAVWQQWRRWRDNGVWGRAMARLARRIRIKMGRNAEPSMVMIDAQTVRGGRAGPTFHNAGGRGGRTIGTKRSVVIEILGLPLAVEADPAKPHDVRSGRDLLSRRIGELPRVQSIVADRGYSGLSKFAAKHNLKLDIKQALAPLPGQKKVFVPIAPLYKVEHTFARLGRWRRLSRCYEGTAASARAWLEVAAVGYLLARIRVEPT